MQKREYSDVGGRGADGNTEGIAVGTVVSTRGTVTYRLVCCSHAVYCWGWTGEFLFLVVFANTFVRVSWLPVGYQSKTSMCFYRNFVCHCSYASMFTLLVI